MCKKKVTFTAHATNIHYIMNKYTRKCVKKGNVYSTCNQHSLYHE